MTILHYIQTSEVGWFLILSVKVSLLLILALLICRLLKDASASTRHFFMSAALLLIMLLPLVSAALPTFALFSYPSTVSYATVQATAPKGEPDERSSADILPAVSSEHGETVSEITGEVSPSFSALMAIYLLGAAYYSLRLLAAHLWMRRLRRSATLLHKSGEPLERIADEVARRLKLSRAYHLMISERLTVPVCCGWFKPAVILPPGAHRWTDAQSRSVFLHEFAHIKRRDTLISASVHLVAVWQWFNPLVWIALRRCNLDREKACDDCALSAGAHSLDYADHLVTIGRFRNGLATFSRTATSEYSRLQYQPERCDVRRQDRASSRDCLSNRASRDCPRRDPATYGSDFTVGTANCGQGDAWRVLRRSQRRSGI